MDTLAKEMDEKAILDDKKQDICDTSDKDINGVDRKSESLEEQKVTPWNVEGKIDYLKLIKQFGTELIDNELLEKFKRITGKDIHPWLRRGIFFSHRGLHQFLNAYENGDPVFLYTGRGPTTDAMHVGHLIPFLFTKWLQDVFDCPLIIQISDEEKAAFKKLNFKDVYKMGFENAKEIISCGFNPEKTFIFSNRDYRMNCAQYESFAHDMKFITPLKEMQKIFGLNEESTIAMYDWPIYQSAAAFYQAYPHIFKGRPAFCLVPYAIDQDPYFRLARDLATKMNLIKPCSIMCTFIPPLTGTSGKMSSSSGTDATLFLNDEEKVLTSKVMKHCFSGGGGNGTLEDHKKYGGNPDVDIAYQYLRYFEDNDEVLQNIHDNFKKGDLSCGEIKKLMVERLMPIINQVKANRAKITKEVLDEFYKIKPIVLPLAKPKKLEEQEQKLYESFEKLNIEYRTKYHAPLVTKEDFDDLSQTLEGTICKVVFLKGKDNFYLYAINSSTTINMKTIHKRLNQPKIRFGENDTLTLILQVPKTAASLYAIMNDREKQLSIIIDDNIPKEAPVNFFAMRQDAHAMISYENMIKFVESFGYKITYLSEK